MFVPCQIKKSALVAFLLLAITKSASAQDIHYHYVRPNGSSLAAFSPRPSYAFIRGRVYYFSPLPQLDPPPPNTWLQFRHPFTHSYVTVPVNLPNGIPRIENHHDRVLYNYGDYSVVIHFVRDGSVDVSYKSLN
jgi:hypothetical protein